MKKCFKFVLFLLLLISSSSAFAQISADPQDSFYEDAQNWFVKGYIEQLPPLRPYPVQNIKNILNEVMEKGSEKDRAVAQAHYERLTGKNLYIFAETNVSDRFDCAKKDNTLGSMNYGGVEGDMDTMDGMLSMGYIGGIALINKFETEVNPLWVNAYHDAFFDPISLNPFSAFIDINGLMTGGTENFYGQLGVNKTGFGYFLDNGFALNDTAFHAPTLSVSYLGGNWSFVQAIRVLGATENAFDKEGRMAIYPNKFMAFHQASAMFAKNLEVTYYESVVFGTRFDPSYITPMTFMVSQNFSGFDDNFQLGIGVNYRPMKGLHWNTDFYLDDVNANQICRLNFDTRFRFALATGIVYASDIPWLDRVTFDLEGIMPYMYSHWNFNSKGDNTLSSNTVNYQNYTNCGFSVGSSTPPDSGIIRAGATFRPLDNLKVDVSAAFTAHGNIAEDSTLDEAMEYLLAEEGVYQTDGSELTQTVYLDETNTKRGYNHTAASEKFKFLTQDHLMFVLQAGADATWDLKPLEWCSVSLYSGLSLEGIWNKGVDSNIFPGGKTSVVKAGDGTVTGWKYNDTVYSTKQDVVDAAMADWVDGMYNTMNVYFKLGAKIRI